MIFRAAQAASGRYILDALYGSIKLPDFVWDVLSCPEIQRLREVRLCNTNSLCLTGAANVNRFEHAIGTCYLAKRCLEDWPVLSPITEKERRQFLLAALLHDVASAPFGHSAEYVENREGFRHETGFEDAVIGQQTRSYNYKTLTLEPIFFGGQRELCLRVSEDDVRAIGKIIAGEGRFGPLLNRSIDLDNLDNVYRLAYHMGIVGPSKVPLDLAGSVWVERDSPVPVIKAEAVPLVIEWQRVRKRLYSVLLLNPEEFSAKCMLTEALEYAKGGDGSRCRWYDADFELVQKLREHSSQTREISERLMTGRLYGCIGIFSSSRVAKHGVFCVPKRRREIEHELSKMLQTCFKPRLKSATLALHAIRDVDKTERQVEIRTDRRETLTLGSSSKRLLVGAFFKNVDWDIYGIGQLPVHVLRDVRDIVSKRIALVLGDESLREMTLYDEIKAID